MPKHACSHDNGSATEAFLRKFFCRMMQMEHASFAIGDPDEPATFNDVMGLECFEERARTAREHGFPPEYLLLATSGNGPEAQLNRILCGWRECEHQPVNLDASDAKDSSVDAKSTFGWWETVDLSKMRF